MNSGFVHLKQSIKGAWKKVLLIGLALFSFEMLFSLLAMSTHIQAEMLKKMQEGPAAAQKVLGEGFMDAIVKYGVITFGYIHPFLFMLFISFIFAVCWQLVSAEVANGSIGFTLSRPISRKKIFFNLALVIYLGLGFLALVTFSSTALGISIFLGGKLSLTPFISLVWNLYLLMIFIAGYITLFASFSDSGKKFFTYPGVLLFLFYILDLAANLWRPLEIISPINPFSYYNPMKILIGSRIGFMQSFMILAISGVMFVISAFIFNRRDLPSG